MLKSMCKQTIPLSRAVQQEAPMKTIPPRITDLLGPIFGSAFSSPTLVRVMTLILGAVMTAGSRTVANVVRTLQFFVEGDVSTYQRVFSCRQWSTWAVSRGLCSLILRYIVPEGTV